jgi:hypothetical protein
VKVEKNTRIRENSNTKKFGRWQNLDIGWGYFANSVMDLVDK